MSTAASAPAEKPTASKSSTLKVVTKHVEGNGEQPDPVDVPQLEQALTQFAAEQTPMLRRADAARNRVAQTIREVESALSDVQGREAMLDRLYAAAKEGIKAQVDDLTEELALYQHGLAPARNE